VWCAVAGAAACVAAALAGSASPQGSATVTVRVEVRDASFTLSRRSVRIRSTVRFVVHNRGQASHRFVIAGKRTRALRRGQTQTIILRFLRKGSYPFRFTVGKRTPRGLRGRFSVVDVPAPAPAPDPPPLDVVGSTALASVGTFERPVFVTAPTHDDRIFVVEQTGVVRVIGNGEVLSEPFLDLREQVTASGESGLLSIAFAPDYAESGLVYAFYNTRFGAYGDIRIAEFRRDATDPNAVDPSSERALLTIPKPYENHNGGMLQFGPDGHLYASVGDGDPGAVNPPGFFARRLDVLLGKILRIAPRGGDPYAVPSDNPFVGVEGARPEIWAYGLRNPWRFWVDHETGAMIIADVGSTSREELNLIPQGDSGLNFGWPCFEGSLVFDSTATCEKPVLPILEFPRDNGVCAVIGGVVVAPDARIPALAGRYLYGDLCAGTITVVAIQNGRVSNSAVLDVTVPGLATFGVDGRGRVYVASTRGGVYRLDPKPVG
jgi:glucose/arabinose dehydrogenase